MSGDRREAMTMAQIATGATLNNELQRALGREPAMMAWIDAGRLVMGDFPHAAWIFDFGSECFVRSAVLKMQAPPGPDHSGGRLTGNVFLAFLGAKHRFKSRKALLVGALMMIESERPGTLKKLEVYKPRTKRVVAHKAELLYENPDLVEKFSIELIPGWFMATNNSTAEVDRYLRKAAELAGFVWGRDI